LKLFEGPALEDAVLEEFFLREREALEALKHPNIVEMRAAGFDPDRDQYYVALEWLDEALLDYIKRCEEEGVGEERNPGAGWDSFSQLTLVPLLDGLAMAHSRRIWHRDIKPQNVMMDPDGHPKLADFGLAKVVDSLRFGLTVRDFYSRPYSAPERVHGELDQRSDLYSLGVTALRCLLPREYQLDDSKIASALDDADVPDDARHFLAQLVAPAPDDRFPSTKIAQAELRRLLVWRPSVGADAVGTLRLKLTQRAIEEIAVYIAETSPEVVTKYILRDLSEEPAIKRQRPRPGQWQPEEEGFEFLGQEFVYITRFDRQGLGTIIGIRELPTGLLDKRREESLAVRSRVTFSGSVDGLRHHVDELFEELARHEQLMLVEAARRAERELFDRWSGVLDAKSDLEGEREDPLNYQSVRLDRNQATFSVLRNVDESLLDQTRRVVLQEGGAIVGTIIEATGSSVVMHIEQGETRALPSTGQLLHDRSLSRRAIEQQRRALRALQDGSSSRPDLADLLVDATKATSPTPHAVADFVQPDLDDAKQDAVKTALGSPDFTLVEGPPGTGKTTFITELICQLKKDAATGPVLLTSQTHVAVDNVATRLAELRPDLKIVRIGRPERIAEEAKGLSVASQLDRWRDESQARAKQFIADWARERGIQEPARLAHADIAELRLLDEKTRNAGRRIKELDTEEESLLDKLTDPTATDEEMPASSALVPDLNDELIAVQEEREGKATEQRQLLETREKIAKRVAAMLELDPEGDTGEFERAIETRFPIKPADLAKFNELVGLQDLWLQRFGGQRDDFQRALIEVADVVAGTCVGLASTLGAVEMSFEMAIVDEASKATPTEALVPMIKSNRWVMVGDSKQLPPFVDDALRRQGFLEQHELRHEDLTETIFGRLLESMPDHRVTLTTQHRMLEPIGELVSQCFYGGKLKSTRTDASSFDSLKRALPGAVTWLSTSRLAKHHEQSAGGTSYWNQAEVNAIREYVQTLHFYAEKADEHLDVGVISAYASQVAQLRRALRPDDGRWTHLSLDVHAVDSFQGQERDVIFYSVTRSNSSGQIGFLRSPERLNVALSRGRDALVLVGDLAFCDRVRSEQNPFRPVVDHLRRHHNECKIVELADG